MFAPAAIAAGLGEIVGTGIIGQQLAIRIPLHGSDSRHLTMECVSLTPGDGGLGIDPALATTRIAIDFLTSPAALLITSREPLHLPIIQFEITLGCGLQLNRGYRLLPAAPGTTAPAIVATTLGKLKATPSPSTELVIDQPTTLRLISRQRYPRNANARVRFIQRMAVANPQLFLSTQAAFDQPLAAGTQLQLPPARSAPPIARPRKTPTSEKGRLIIGHSDALPPPTAAEIDSRMNRLIDIMNEQLRIQISLVERINQLESDITAARQLSASQAALNQQLEQDIRQLKEAQAQQSVIQLVLAILLGGFAGAVFLLWRDRTAQPTFPVQQPVTPTAVPLPPKASTSRIQSIFDDLLKPK